MPRVRKPQSIADLLGVKKPKKRLSGAQWRKRQKQGLTSNKRGRPRGSVRMLQLYQDIANGLWEKDPDWPYWPDWYARDRFTTDFLLSRYGDLERSRLIAVLRKHWPERYEHLSDKTLSRYIGAVLTRYVEGGRIFVQEISELKTFSRCTPADATNCKRPQGAPHHGHEIIE
jgi:hypothetical protein